MMTRNGGQEAKAGFWWNMRSWEVTLVKATGDSLPGGDAVKFVRIPTLALVLLGPAMGALFVMFLPLIGFAMLFSAVATKLAKSIAATGRSMADTMHSARAHPATLSDPPSAKRCDGPAGRDDGSPAPRS